MNASQHIRSFGVFGSSALLAGLTFFSASAQADLDLTSDPLFLGTAVQPNIMFTLDDSGSMHWEVTPDSITQPYYAFPRSSGIYGGGDYTNSVPVFTEGSLYVARLRSAHTSDTITNNTTYYDPEINYQPWIRADGTRYPDADPEEAYHNPYETERGSRNLIETSTEYARWFSSGNNAQWENHSFYPATYYIFDGGNEYDYDSYTRVEIRDNDDFNDLTIGGENRTDCADPMDCTYDEEIQNFANWYQYHRSRILAARGGIGEAFEDLNETVRIGYGSINSPGSSLGTFDQDAKAEFFESLYGDDIPQQGTPLRRAAQEVGDYFETSDDPWEGPDGELLECRLSYHILMTDGYWNQNLPQSVGNVTGSSGPVIEAPDGRTYQYQPRSPIQDSYSNTLADVAMHYWVRDLRPDLDNRVPVRGPYRDKSDGDDNWARPGFWQHLVTLGVGLGVEGSVARDDAYNAVSDDDPDDFDWDNPFGDVDEPKIDDLLRASIGTRGDFFSAMNPVRFAEELSEMLNNIVAEATRSASVTSTNTSFAQEGTRVYQAQLDSEDWSGDIYAYEVDSETGQVLTPGNPDWRASENMPDNRNIVTWFDDDGAPFNWATISDDDDIEDAFEDAVGNDPEQLVAYLRGDQSNEASEGGPYRTRSSLIGDIVNSDLQFVGTENYGFTALPNPEGDAYRIWRRSNDTYNNRPDMVYVASNAGMLHAINVEEGPQEGQEMFAYVPGDILGRLPDLADPDYSHQFFVDGSPTVSDAYINYPDGTRWGTVLVGTSGLGGRSVFALDITDPESFSENNVLWEFTHDDLGYGVQDAVITRLGNGQWVAVFGNGYNSDDHGSSLFVVDLATGDLVDHVEAGEGDDNAPNGMAGPVAVDMYRDASADWFYAGDLHGSLWRFDVNTNGSVSLEATEVFQTEIEQGRRQPITTRPVVGDHPDAGNLMVYVGTGKFLEEGDNQILANEQEQSFYAIIDDGTKEGIDNLLSQTIIDQGTATFGGQALPVRTVSENTYDETNPEDGWRIDLDQEEGERVITPARVIGDRIRFVTFIPTDDPCIAGGINWIMEMDAISGARLQDPVYDFSGDGDMDFGDGGFRVDGPPISGDNPGTRDDDGREILDPNPEDTEGPRPPTEPPEDSDYYGRQSWRDYR